MILLSNFEKSSIDFVVKRCCDYFICVFNELFGFVLQIEYFIIWEKYLYYKLDFIVYFKLVVLLKSLVMVWECQNIIYVVW